MRRVLIATSNPGKLRDFAGAARAHGINIAGIPDFSELPTPVEDGLTFDENARKKAEEYSLAVPGEIVLADDSGLEVAALNGGPGVHSARYAADEPHLADTNTDDEANNARVCENFVMLCRRNEPLGSSVCGGGSQWKNTGDLSGNG